MRARHVVLGALALVVLAGAALFARMALTLRAGGGGGATRAAVTRLVLQTADRRELEQDRKQLAEIRKAWEEGRHEDALALAETAAAERSADFGSLVHIEKRALEWLVDRDTFAPVLAPQVGVPGAPGQPTFEQMIAERPNGLGAPDSPLRPLAIAYLTSAFASRGAARIEVDQLAPAIGTDAGALVDVLSACADVPRWTDAGDAAAPTRRAERRGCVDLCQELLDYGVVTKELCDDLAAIASDSDRPQRERALAAMALAELADLPIGLRWDLPRDDTDAATAPRHFVSRAWQDVRDLDAAKGYRFRVGLAVTGWRALTPSHTELRDEAALRRRWDGVRLWVAQHVDPGAMRSAEAPASAVAVAERRVAPVDHLRALAGGATEPAGVLAVMEQREDLRLPLHHLLLLTADVASPPRRTATTWHGGIVTRWRTALGLDTQPVTIRVARVLRTLGGPELVDETKRVLRAGEPLELQWAEELDLPSRSFADWTFPGELPRPPRRPVLRETLEIGLAWNDTGLFAELEGLSLHVQHAHGGGGTSTSGTPWPEGMPVALAIRPGSSVEAAEPRVYLVHVERGAHGDAPWTLDDWRRRGEDCLATLDEGDKSRAEFFLLGHALRSLVDELALLRAQVDVDRLDGLELPPGPGPSGVRRLAAFARDGEPTPTGKLQNLATRDLVEIALDAPRPADRATASALLRSPSDLAAPLARQIVALDAERADALPEELVRASERTLEEDAREAQGLTVFRVVTVLVVWLLVAGLLALAVLRRDRPHGARGAAALLLIAGWVVVQLSLFHRGVDMSPAWAGWTLAAVAAWLLGRGLDTRPARAAVTCCMLAATVSLVAHLGGLATRIPAALAAVAASVAVAPLAPALFAGLRPPGSLDPRRPFPSLTWGLVARSIAGAALVGIAALAIIDSASWDSIPFVVIPAWAVGGVAVSRLGFARGLPGRPLPIAFTAGMVLAGLGLVVLQAIDETTPGGQPRLARDTEDVLRTIVACALAFALLRILDAARIRSRADADAAG